MAAVISFAINGQEVSRDFALNYVVNKALHAGHCEQEVRSTFRVACTPSGEEQRDTIMAVSGYALEIDVEEAL